LIPFAMLPVAALLAGDSRWTTVATFVALGLALAGALVLLLFQGVGGRIPDGYKDPLVQTVWPLWTGQVPLPGWRFFTTYTYDDHNRLTEVTTGERFCRNLVSLPAPDWIARLTPPWQAVQFVPLLLAQGLAILGLWRSRL
jgi:hypothetical protein